MSTTEIINQNIEDELPDLEVPGKKFRMQNQKMMFTYKHHINKERLIAWIREQSKTQCKFIRVAHESGDEKNNYLHSHVVIDFGKQVNTSSARHFDIEQVLEDGTVENVHPNMKKILGDKHFQNAVRYLGKEDTDNADLLTFTSNIADRVWSHDTVQDALRDITDIREVTGTIALHAMRPQVRYWDYTLETLRPFQEKLWNIMQGKPDGRSIYWLWDTVGNVGKTTFVKHCDSVVGDKVRYSSSLGSAKDCACWIRNIIENQRWRGDTLLIDLPRSYDGRDSIYEGLEMLSNSMCTSMKYVGGSLIWQPNHVIVTANFLPDQSKMSKDRWKLWRIYTNEQEGGEVDMHPLTLKEGCDFREPILERPTLRRTDPTDRICPAADGRFAPFAETRPLPPSSAYRQKYEDGRPVSPFHFF